MKTPFLRALSAALYIVAIVLIIQLFAFVLKDQKDTIIIPMTMLSLFVLSAAVMGYLFLSEPLQLLVENKKKEAISSFAKTVGFFACFVVAFVILLFSTRFLPFGDKQADLKPIASTIYTCDKGRTISAVYYKGADALTSSTGMPVPTGSVAISLDGGPTMKLSQTVSGSGVRYANADESFVFWNKGTEALIMRDGVMELQYTNCLTK